MELHFLYFLQKKLLELADSSWEKAWDIAHTTDSWKHETGKDIRDTGIVTARYFNDLGKIFRLQVS